MSTLRGSRCVAGLRRRFRVVTVGSVVIRSRIRTSFTSFRSATARTMSASVIRPSGRLACSSSTTTRAVAPACFIRYAAAATWSSGFTVDSAGRMTSAAVGGACGRCGDGCCAEAPVMIRSVSGDLDGIPARSGRIHTESPGCTPPQSTAQVPGCAVIGATTDVRPHTGSRSRRQLAQPWPRSLLLHLEQPAWDDRSRAPDSSSCPAPRRSRKTGSGRTETARAAAAASLRWPDSGPRSNLPLPSRLMRIIPAIAAPGQAVPHGCVDPP